MVNEKARIIRKLGIPCTIRYLEGTVKTSKFLVKRASTVFNSLLSVEAHRKGDFLPESNVRGGCIVTNNTSGESYVVVAIFPETFQEMVLAHVSHMLVVNTKLTVTRDEVSADKYGDVTNTPKEVISDSDVYVELVTQDLRQSDVGIHLDAEYLIYSPAFDATLLDRLIINNYITKDVALKVVSVDHTTYPGVVCIQAKSETRE